MKKYFKYILIAIICLIVIGCGIVIALVLKPKHSLDNESLDSKKEQYECISTLTNDENLVEKSFLEVSVSKNRVNVVKSLMIISRLKMTQFIKK